MTALWTVLAGLFGFFFGVAVACAVAANKVRDLEIMHRAACNALAVMDEELRAHQDMIESTYMRQYRKPPRRMDANEVLIRRAFETADDEGVDRVLTREETDAINRALGLEDM